MSYRHAFSSSGLNRQSKLIDDHPGLQAHQEPSRVSPFVGSFDSGRRTPVNYDDVQVLKRTRFLLLPSSGEVIHEVLIFVNTTIKFIVLY